MSLIKEELQTSKINLTERRIVKTDFNLDDLNDGEIIVEIESFAFTSNNVTYGVAGDMMGYWQFFPTTEDPGNIWGCIPMWGFSKIIFKVSIGIITSCSNHHIIIFCFTINYLNLFHKINGK